MRFRLTAARRNGRAAVQELMSYRGGPLVLVAIWCVPYAVLAVFRYGLGHGELGSPASWVLGFFGLQLFATSGVFRQRALARILLCGAAVFYAGYLSRLVPGFAAVSSVLPQVCIAALMALAVWLPFSSGQLSLAQAGFMAIGAYGSAWLTVHEHWPFFAALVASAATTAAIGLVISYPALRLRGIYLAIATLGLGEVVRIFFVNFEPTGGAFGFPAIPKFTDLWHLIVVIVAVATLLSFLMRSRIGRAIAAVRQDVIAAAVLGVKITRIRMLTFTLGALLAGLAGGFQAHYIRFITPENYGLPALVEWLAMVMLGGAQTFVGPLVGAVVLGTLPELLRFLADWRLAISGVILVALLLFRPDGIITRDLLGWGFARRGVRPADNPAIQVVRVGDEARDLLVVRDLTKRFGAITAVNRVSFTVRRGGIHAIIGPNGAGKTTLFNVVSGLYRLDGGEILFRGSSIHGLGAQGVVRAGIARTFQNVRLFADMTVLENVLLGGHTATRSGAFRCALGLASKEERSAIAHALHLLSMLELTELAHEPARNLSYGDQRRVEIARALASNPALVLLDEPAAGMNAVETAALAAFIRRVAVELDKTILIIEHDMELVMGLCSQVTVLNFGTLIADGPPSFVQRAPAVVAAYLGTPSAAPRPVIAAARNQRRQNFLEVEALTTCYGRIEAVKGISLTVASGEIVALVGANGAGKSTTLLTISGVLRSTAGIVRLRGEVISGLPAHEITRRGLAQVVEGRAIFQELTVIENLLLGAYVRADRAVVRRDLDVQLERFPRLGERRDQLAGALSGGEQQMLAIARALMSTPEVLMLDEPSMGLAPLILDEIFNLIAEISRGGTTILLVEQNARRALQLSHRAYAMANGHIVAAGDSRSLLADEQLQRTYLGYQSAPRTTVESSRFDPRL